MSVIVNMVTKNEEYRYLEACLNWVSRITDKIFVYDDQSTDGTVEVIKSFGCEHMIRPDMVPSFREAEGDFRYCGWTSMLQTFTPRIGDWVLCIDADEFPIGDLNQSVEILERGGWRGANLKIWEIWNLDPIAHRTDGFWGDISGVRMCRIENEDHAFRSSRMGAGSVPSFAMKEPCPMGSLPLEILHLGYADPEDQSDKYDFYVSHAKNGHNNQHIQSIITLPTLELWTGEQPNVWRGVK